MVDPLAEKDELSEALELAANEARRYLEGIESDPVLRPGTEDAIGIWNDPMPEEGDGTLATIAELADRGWATATRSSGPRFFHSVMGGGPSAAPASASLTSDHPHVPFASAWY